MERCYRHRRWRGAESAECWGAGHEEEGEDATEGAKGDEDGPHLAGRHADREPLRDLTDDRVEVEQVRELLEGAQAGAERAHVCEAAG